MTKADFARSKYDSERSSYFSSMQRLKVYEELFRMNALSESKLQEARYETMSAKYLRTSNEDSLGSSTKDEVKKFSYFDAFYRQKDLVKRAQETPAFLDEFVEWVKEDRFKKAQNVRDLPKILGNKKACRAFYDNSPEEAFDEAMHILYEHKPEKVDRFYKKIREFRDLINDAEALKIKTEIEENKNKKAELQQCYKDLKRFCREIGLEI